MSIQDLIPITGSGQTPPPDLLDSLIYAAIVLFILSVITEKLTQLVRAYPMQFRWIGVFCCLLFYIPVGKSIWDVTMTNIDVKTILPLKAAIVLLLINTALLILILANMRWFKAWVKPKGSKKPNAAFDWMDVLSNIDKKSVTDTAKGKAAVNTVPGDTVEKEVTVLSFMLGFLIAYTFNANLFGLFRNPMELGWGGVAPFVGYFYALNPAYFGLNFLPVIGFALTAFFLSFGAKFFHDLLDMLLQVKNLKRKLATKETYESETVQELDEFLKFSAQQLAQKAIDDNLSELKKLPNFHSVHPGFDLNGNESVVYLNLTDDKTTGIKDKLEYRLTDKKVRTVRVIIVPKVNRPKVTVSKIWNPADINYIGSVGVPITLGGNNFWLTCAHVLHHGAFDPATMNGVINPQPHVQFTLGTPDVLNGSVYYGYQDNEFDIALVIPQTGAGIRSSNLSAAPFEISTLRNSISVAFEGAVSSAQGVLIAKDVSEDIDFLNGITVPMKGLLKISNSVFLQSISQPGDSGALLYSEDRKAVGLIIAANDQYTYAMSLERILSSWGATIY